MTVASEVAGPTAARTNPRRISTPVWVALGIVYVVWGSTYLAIRYAIDSIPPFTSGALRFVLAGLILFAFLAIRRGRSALRVTRRQFGSAALVGVLLLLGGNGGVVLAEQSLPTGVAALLVASVPLWVVLWRAALRDRPDRRTLLGVALGFVGLAVLTLPGSHHASGGHSYVWGVVFVVFAALSWSFGSVGTKTWLTMPEDPFVATAYEMVAGGLACGIAALLHGEHVNLDAVTGKSLLATGYLVVFGSLVAFSSYVWLLHTAPISLVATYAYVNPVVAVALGALFLHESVTSTVVLGGLIVVAGVAVVISTESRSRADDRLMTEESLDENT
jgi:drug/metabolite transporter (DMT)-like permease